MDAGWTRAIFLFVAMIDWRPPASAMLHLWGPVVGLFVVFINRDFCSQSIYKIIVTYILCGSTVQLVGIHPGHNYSHIFYRFFWFVFFFINCGGRARHAFICNRTSNTHSDGGVKLIELPVEGQVTLCRKKTLLVEITLCGICPVVFVVATCYNVMQWNCRRSRISF